MSKVTKNKTKKKNPQSLFEKITLHEALTVAKEGGLSVRRKRDGCVQLECLAPFLRFIISSKQFNHDIIQIIGTDVINCIVLTRERVLPEIYRRSSPNGSLFRNDKAARAIKIKSSKTLLRFLKIVSQSGGGVSDDIYVFSPNYSWLIYVSHHDEILVEFSI